MSRSISLHEVEVGCIISLPQIRKYTDSDFTPCVTSRQHPNIPRFCGLGKVARYDSHPFVVLEKKDEGILHVVQISSCSYKSTEKFREDQRDPEKRYIAHFSPIAVEFGLQLNYRLEDSQMMPKIPCFLLIPHSYCLPASRFRLFGENAYTYRLTKKSYVRLMDRLGLPPAEFISTEILRNINQPAAQTSHLSPPPLPSEDIPSLSSLWEFLVETTDTEDTTSRGHDLFNATLPFPKSSSAPTTNSTSEPSEEALSSTPSSASSAGSIGPPERQRTTVLAASSVSSTRSVNEPNETILSSVLSIGSSVSAQIPDPRHPAPRESPRSSITQPARAISDHTGRREFHGYPIPIPTLQSSPQQNRPRRAAPPERRNWFQRFIWRVDVATARTLRLI